jgi:6-phosphogluconolactonase
VKVRILVAAQTSRRLPRVSFDLRKAIAVLVVGSLAACTGSSASPAKTSKKSAKPPAKSSLQQPGTVSNSSVSMDPPAAFAGGYGAQGLVRVVWTKISAPRPEPTSIPPADGAATPKVVAQKIRESAPSTIATAPSETLVNVSTPTFVSVHPKLRVYYVTSEQGSTGKNLQAIDQNGQVLSVASSRGSNPVRSVVSGDGQRLAVANYDGSVALFALKDDGSIDTFLDSVKTAGSGPKVKRQESSHPHAVLFAGSDQLLVSDLGADVVRVFNLGPQRESLTESTPIMMAAGSGPRQVVLSRDSKSAYVIGELDSSITVLKRDEAGVFSIAGRIPIVPNGALAEGSLHPNGQWLIVLNRGPDTCVVVDLQTQTPTVNSASECGAWPRYATFASGGSQIVVAAQKSDELITYPFDAATGQIGPRVAVARLDGAAMVVVH